MTLLEALAAAAALVLASPSLVAMCAIFRRQGRSPESGDTALPRLLFLVPAHDEQEMIGHCIQSLTSQNYPASHRDVVVIADNCSDETSDVARSAGAKVLERNDPQHRGKPRALAWAIELLRLDDCDAVVIVDADTEVDAGFAAGLVVHAPLAGKAVQTYFGTLNEWDNWLTRLAGLLARARYEVVYPAKARAGLNVPLTGNGMCIGRDLLANGGWQSFGLTEDLELYARLTSMGIPIRYSRNSLLYSQEVTTLAQGRTQRDRWARGRLEVLLQSAPIVWRSTLIGWTQKADVLMELALPSPVLRFVIALSAMLFSLLLAGPWRLVLAVGALGFVAPDIVALSIALLRHPQRGRTLAALLMLPWYAAWRVMVATRGAVSPRDMTWRKTARNR